MNCVAEKNVDDTISWKMERLVQGHPHLQGEEISQNYNDLLVFFSRNKWACSEKDFHCKISRWHVGLGNI